MQRYHKAMVFLSYFVSIIALLAILVDNRKDKLYSFHIWQAFFLNLVIAVAAILIYTLWLPQYMLTLDLYTRTAFFMKVTLIPVSIVNIAMLILGIIAASGVKFKIPLIGHLANKIAGE